VSCCLASEYFAFKLLEDLLITEDFISFSGLSLSCFLSLSNFLLYFPFYFFCSIIVPLPPPPPPIFKEVPRTCSTILVFLPYLYLISSLLSCSFQVILFVYSVIILLAVVWQQQMRVCLFFISKEWNIAFFLSTTGICSYLYAYVPVLNIIMTVI
jgi:hypothetical protein